MDAKSKFVWGKSDAYEAFVGRWSRLLAPKFVAWLNRPPGQHWLDIGCGTGALTQAILTDADPASIRSIDAAEGFIERARQQVTDPRARFSVGDAQHIDAETATFDVVVAGLVLNFIPDLDAALKEMMRVTKPGGLIAAYVWDYGGKAEFMRYFWDAAIALRPEDRNEDEGVRSPICHPEIMAATFAGIGLNSVETQALDVPTPFRDFDDYWQPFLPGQGSAPRYAMSLSEADRAAVRERLRATLPTAADGSIPLMARAWAVRGVRA